MSLRTELNNLIRDSVYLPYEQMVKHTIEAGYKPATGERRLRKSESPNVVPEFKKSRRNTKYISGYWWKEIGRKVEGEVVGTADSKTETVHYRPGYLKQQKLESARLI